MPLLERAAESPCTCDSGGEAITALLCALPNPPTLDLDRVSWHSYWDRTGRRTGEALGSRFDWPHRLDRRFKTV